jgi:hypothetical protein
MAFGMTRCGYKFVRMTGFGNALVVQMLWFRGVVKGWVVFGALGAASSVRRYAGSFVTALQAKKCNVF